MPFGMPAVFVSGYYSLTLVARKAQLTEFATPHEIAAAVDGCPSTSTQQIQLPSPSIVIFK
jgi:hypothetical protein